LKSGDTRFTLDKMRPKLTNTCADRLLRPRAATAAIPVGVVPAGRAMLILAAPGLRVHECGIRSRAGDASGKTLARLATRRRL